MGEAVAVRTTNISGLCRSTHSPGHARMQASGTDRCPGLMAGPQLVALWLVGPAFHWPWCWPASVGDVRDNRRGKTVPSWAAQHASPTEPSGLRRDQLTSHASSA